MFSKILVLRSIRSCPLVILVRGRGIHQLLCGESEECKLRLRETLKYWEKQVPALVSVSWNWCSIQSNPHIHICFPANEIHYYSFELAVPRALFSIMEGIPWGYIFSILRPQKSILMLIKVLISPTRTPLWQKYVWVLLNALVINIYSHETLQKPW